MIGRANSDGSAKRLGLQHKSSGNPLIENQRIACPFTLFARALVAALPAIVAAAATPRGGLRATEGIPPCQRPVRLSGHPRVEK